MKATSKREPARAEQVVPGLWRLRLPMPWPAVPYVNAWALSAPGGVVLVDTGRDMPGAIGPLEAALEQAGLRLDHVGLLVCTHAHSDHYGVAGPIVEAARCELWMHPDHAHATHDLADVDEMIERRSEIARHRGVPEDALRRFAEWRRPLGTGIAKIVLPDRGLVPGVEIETDVGVWQVHETPGHAPSHVVLHQPDRGLLISGDHLLGRVWLYYDLGYTPDPAGEFLRSLDVVDALEARLCLGGHGLPFDDVHARVQAHRAAVNERMERVLASLDGAQPTPFEIVPALIGDGSVKPMMLDWTLSETVCYLHHLELRGKVARVEGSDPERWELSG